MIFSLHQEGLVMLSQATHKIIEYTPLSPYTWHLSLDLQHSSCPPFYSLSQPHHVTASQPYPGDDHQSTEGRSERTQCQAKTAACNSFSYICTMALHCFLSFAHCHPASTVIPQSPKATFTLSIPTSVYLVPAIHLLPP